ncbi:uncharacterized protein HGUI_01652 [Hanseniaspora guilliermondii]|uniref:DOC domain-containing protein n=1 Tax=Hanseniaspora guilliermondii TaxID=56406 RepID=A0A1L0B0X9_9ASCO|nr:uncharacterized protein HGUI_01652 [Hanseniaspora guilliermondii]
MNIDLHIDIDNLEFPNIRSVYDQIINEKDHTLPSLSDELKKDILYLRPYEKKFYSFTNHLDKNIIDQKTFLYNFEHNVCSDSTHSKDYYEQNSYQTQLHLGYLLYTLDDYKSLQSFLCCTMESYGKGLDNVDLKSFNKLRQARKKLPIESEDSPYMTLQDSMDHLNFENLKTAMNEKSFFEKVEKSEQEKIQTFGVKQTLLHIFDIGSSGLPLLLGYDKKLSIKNFVEQMSKIKDITLQAEWESSSHKKDHGIISAIYRDIDTSWQSNGFLPHIIDVKFFSLTRINNIMMYFSNSQNSSYAPFHIKIYGGTSEFDLTLLKDIGIKRVEGFINLFFFDTNIKNKVVSKDDQRFKHIHGLLKNGYVYNPPILVKYLKIFIFSNKHRGKDSKLESIRIYQDLETNNALDIINEKEKSLQKTTKKDLDWFDIMNKMKKDGGDVTEEENIQKINEDSSSNPILGNYIII